MAIIKCNECNKEISSEAKSCPHCGYSKISSYTFNFKWLLLAIAVTVAVVLSINKYPILNKNNDAEKSVLANLADPDSAKISNVFTGKDSTVICGDVNAKNRMGAYTGNIPFMYDKKTSQVMFIPDSEIQAYEFMDFYASVGKPEFDSKYNELKYKCEAPADYAKKCLGKNDHAKIHPLCEHINSTELLYKIKSTYYD